MRYIILLAPALAVLLLGCSPTDNTDSEIMIMSWNVQNFFDDVDDGTEYYEFDPSNGEWDYDSFSRKSSALADLITASVPGGPDIILLQEVENANALDHLNRNGLKASGYEYCLFLPTEGSAIGIGVLSRFPPAEVLNHAVNYGGKSVGRNIGEILFELPDGLGRLHVFVNHWKSRLGGAEETEPMRAAAAGMLSSLISDCLAGFPGEPVIAAGDFNESHDEAVRVGGAYTVAIRPDSAEASSDAFSLVYAGSIERMPGDDPGLLFNPWTESECRGSYFYNECWETIDQFFLSADFFDGSGLEYAGFSTVALEFNATAEGLPVRWQASSGTGCSDHLPLLLTLKPVR